MASKVTVEFGDENGRNFAFAPLQRNVRGRFAINEIMSREGSGVTPGEAMSGMPPIPGQHLDIDVSAKTWRLWDPLSESSPEAKRLLAKVKHVMSKAMLGVGTEELTGIEEVSGKLTDDELVTMLLILKRMEAAGKVRVRRGNFPSDADIEKLPGHELNDLWNTSAHKPMYRKDQKSYESKIAAARG